MSVSSFSRQYVMLRPVDCHARGFARLEVCGGRGSLTLHAACLPRRQSLRALLLDGHSPAGCALDLGVLSVGADHSGALHREELSLSALRGYDAIVLTSDWPDPQICLCGMLHAAARCTRWQLEESLRRYLRVPCADMSPVQPSDEASPARRLPRREAPLPAVAPREGTLAADSLLRLRRLVWPSSVASLRTYFEQLPPCAPFLAPGWRFVRVPLAEGSPADFGVVGMHVRQHAVERVAYALPSAHGTLPPGGLQGYCWQQGRDGQGYWVMVQEAIPDVPPDAGRS